MKKTRKFLLAILAVMLPFAVTWAENGVAKIGNTEYATLQDAFDAAEEANKANIVIDLLDDATLDINARADINSIGTANTETITINGNGKTLTFNQKGNDWNDVSTANDKQTKLILNDMTINNSGYNSGHWKRTNIFFSCAVEMNNVTATAVGFKNDATLNNVTISDNRADIYGIWIVTNGQKVEIDGLTINTAGNGGRGIAIKDEDSDKVDGTSLTINDATFTTNKKAAILVTSSYTVDIEASDLNIAGVAADSENAIWVDKAKANLYGKVTVKGATMIPEDGVDAYQASLSTNDKVDGYYKTLAAAIAAATEGTETTIEMVNDESIDIATTGGLTIAAGKNIILELAGHSIVGNCASGTTSALITNKGTLTIQDNTDTDKKGSGNGKLIAGADPTWTWDGTDNYSGSYASNLIRNEGTLQIESGLLQNVSVGSAAYAVDNYNSGKVTINGGQLTTGKASAIRLFFNNAGSLTINDGIIGGENTNMGVQVQGTGANGVNVSLNGGTYNANVNNNGFAVYAGSGSNWTNSSFTISGGTYNAYVGFTDTFTNVSITDGTFKAWAGSYGEVKFITGGIFSEDPSDYVVDGCIAVKNNGIYIVKEGTYLAQIGGVKYETLEDAFAAAENGDTITLLDNGSGNGIVVPQDKFAEGLTVDFRGFAYTINGETLAGSTGTKTQAFQLLKGNKITFQNGTIVADNKDVKVLIQNYSDLTLDSMTLDATQGTNNIGYVLSTNNGKTVINNTTITAKKDGVAFDACSGWGGYTSNAVEVTGTSVINGNIEVSYYGQEGTYSASLKLTSGTLDGNIVMAKGADKCTITKAEDFEADAPNGYKWEEYVENTYKLVVNVGDVNRDGKVDSADVQAIVNIILDMVPEDADYNREAADVDGDDGISISDVTALIKQIICE